MASLPSLLPPSPALVDHVSASVSDTLGKVATPDLTPIFICDKCFRLFPTHKLIVAHSKRDHHSDDVSHAITWNHVCLSPLVSDALLTCSVGPSAASILGHHMATRLSSTFQCQLDYFRVKFHVVHVLRPASRLSAFPPGNDLLWTTTFEAACPRSLDGGGIRGLSELVMLKVIMHRLMVQENMKRKIDGQPPLSVPPKPCHYFDLIGGTSTGGIIALMLGRLRMDVDTAIKHYDSLAKSVFSDPKRWGDGKFKAAKLEEAVKSAVKDMSGDPESPLFEGDGDDVCRTFVCAMNALNMSAKIPVLFRTYQSRREVQLDCKIWEAARATSAAHTFFKHIEIGRGQPYIDGGLGSNNPSRLLLDEAKDLFGARQIGCLVSIGTGQPVVISIKKPGIFQRILPKEILETLNAMATDCEATHQSMLDLFKNLPNTYFRLNVEQGMQGIEFSEWEKLANIEAHTTQYMKKKEVDERLDSLVNAMRVPRGQLTVEQLSMVEESIL